MYTPCFSYFGENFFNTLSLSMIFIKYFSTHNNVKFENCSGIIIEIFTRRIGYSRNCTTNKDVLSYDYQFTRFLVKGYNFRYLL